MIEETFLPGVRHCIKHDEIAQSLEQILGEPPWIVAGLDHSIDDLEHRAAVVSAERVDDVVEQARIGVAEQRDGVAVGDTVGGCAGHELIEHRLRVAH